jgi:hypothetical protein
MAPAEQVAIDSNVLVALVALSCRDLDITFVANFDADFDYISWLTRLGEPMSL